jgi:hypothetical protein
MSWILDVWFALNAIGLLLALSIPKFRRRAFPGIGHFFVGSTAVGLLDLALRVIP